MMTLFYAAALCILGLVIAFQTGRTRFSSETNLGTGDSFEMLQITRAHGNLIEYALFFLILSFLLETVGQIPNLATGLLGDFFIASRIAHAYGITRPEGKSNFRAAGSFVTVAVLLIQSIWALKISISWMMVNSWGF